MWNEAVRRRSRLVEYVSDWFVREQQIRPWYYNCGDDDELIKWYDDYDKRKAQKAKIK